MTDRELLELLLQKVTSIETTMATKEELAVVKADIKADIAKVDTKLDQLAFETQKDVIIMLQHIDKKTDTLDDKFDALNDRLFNQETQIQRLKKQAK